MQKQNKTTWALLAVYFLLLLIPSFFFSPLVVLQTLYPFFILIGITNSIRIFLLITLPILLSVPAALFFYHTFRSPMNVSFWLIIKPSNLFEVRDYLTLNAIQPIMIGVGLFAYWLYLFRKLSGPIVGLRFRILFMCFLIVPIFHMLKSKGEYLEILHQHFSESFPWNAMTSYIVANKELKNFSQFSLKDEENLVIEKPGFDQQTLVMVLGESAGRSWHQLYGHKVSNNPEQIKNQSNLIVFEDLITVFSHTVFSLPVILTKKDKLAVKSEFLPSFVQVFKKAGYKTFWISNQASLEGSESRIGFYARTTDRQFFFNTHNAIQAANYDDNVIREFLKHTQDPAPKKLFILHLQGSHYGFARRYPIEFKKFKHLYDNTILYTDYLLGVIIQALKQEKNPAAMMYVSDHGLLIDACGFDATHFDNKEAFEIPAVIWASDNWIKSNQKLFNIGRTNTKKKVTSITIFDTLVDLAGIRYNQYEPTLSLLSDKVSVGIRNVYRYDGIQINYDHSMNDSACHIQSTR